MEIYNHPNTITFVLFTISFVYLSWRTFVGVHKYEKLFDFIFLYLFFGILTERVLFILANWIDLNSLEWSIVNLTNTLPASLINLDKFSGFSYLYFFMGAIFGISVYNWVNSIYKVTYETLDQITRTVIISFIPSIILGVIAIMFLNRTTGSEMELSLFIPYLIRIFEFVLLLALFNFFNNFWKRKGGLFTSITMLLITSGEILIDYLDPNYIPIFLGIVNIEQLIGIISIILSINLLLTSIATIQEQEIRKKLIPLKPSMNKGFAISFANRRRVTNPMNMRFRNYGNNKRRSRDSVNNP